MSDRRQLISVGGLLATIGMAAYMVVQLNGQTTGDFTNAALAEVQDSQGQILLRGQFAVADEDDDDIERKARLEPTGIDTDASGEAEVEYPKATPAEQEIEFSVQNVTAGSMLTFLIDGRVVGTATADRRGRAEVELQVKGTAAAPVK